MSRHSVVITTITLITLVSIPRIARADFEPIGLTDDSFNQDVIVEKKAPPPVLPVTTATMDSGTQNTGFTWFERGYLANWPGAGLPEAGTVFPGQRFADHMYRLANDYRTNNAFLLDADHPAANIVFTSPTNFAVLSLLTSSGGNNNVLGYRLQHKDGTFQEGAVTSPNWYSSLDPAWAANGCINSTTFAIADLNKYLPKLYGVDISVDKMNVPIVGISLSVTNGAAHTAVFAVSGATLAGPLEPIDIAGYNQDMIVEAAALKPGFLVTNTTATLEGGSSNVRFTWYEQGYYPPAPETGLPAPGQVITSQVEADHRYILPATYTTNNAMLLDAEVTTSLLTLLKPQCYSAISFLTCSSQTDMTNRCTVLHADHTGETNLFVSKYWLSGEPAAFSAGGRISVSTRLVDQPANAGPYLYSEDVVVTNKSSPVTRIMVTSLAAGPGDHAMILAVSGWPAGTPLPVRPLLTISRGTGKSLLLKSSQAATLQYCTNLATAARSGWFSIGPISSNLTFSSTSGPTRFFRTVSP